MHEVFVDSSVSAGKYVLVAAAEADAKLVKGITINVVDYATDYVPEEEITDNATTGTYNHYAVTYSSNGVETILTHDGACGNGIADAQKDSVAHGVTLTVPDRASIWKAGNTLVFRAKVKNNGGEPRAKLGVWQASNPSVMPIEAPGISDGIAVTETEEWQDVTFTIPVPDSHINGPNDVLFYFGFADTPAGETEGARSMIIKNDSVYLGVEYAYDIRIEADTNIWTPGKTEAINIDCDIVNQVGSTGSLNQEITWLAMDSTRTSVVEGITITESGQADGKATVVVDNYNVPAGDYCIVAVSKANQEFIKGFNFEVEYTPVLSELNLTKSGDTFEASAKLMSCDSAYEKVNALIIIVGMNEYGEMINIETKKLENTFASGAASADSVTLAATEAVHYVNAFLWETTDVENPGIFDITRKEFTTMKTLEK